MRIRYNVRMPELLTNINEKAEEYKGKRLKKLLLIIFVVFLVLGLSIGYVVGRISPDDTSQPDEVEQVVKTPEFYEGTITFIEPFLHPEDEISYVLTDKSGNDVILLKAKDQKLEVSEGHFATVYGKKKRTVEKEDYLLVEKIVIKNAPN